MAESKHVVRNLFLTTLLLVSIFAGYYMGGISGYAIFGTDNLVDFDDTTVEDDMVVLDLSDKDHLTIGAFDVKIFSYGDHLKINMVSDDQREFVSYYIETSEVNNYIRLLDAEGNTKDLSLENIPIYEENEQLTGQEDELYKDGIERILFDGLRLEDEGYDVEEVIPVIINLDINKKYGEDGYWEEFMHAKNEIVANLKSNDLIGTDYIIKDLEIINAIAIEIEFENINRFKEIENIEKVSLDKKVYAQLYDSIDLINTSAMWEIEKNGRFISGENTTIAVIDTGVDYTHPDLGGCFGEECKVIGGYDFVNDDPDPMDDHGHGTHCAATAAGVGTFVLAPSSEIPILFEFDTVSDRYVEVDVESEEGEYNFALIYGNGTHFLGLGERDEERLIVSDNENLTYDDSKDEMFVVSWNNESHGESYILELDDLDFQDGVIFRNVITGDGYSETKENGTFYVEDIPIKVTGYDYDLDIINLSIGENVSFNRIYDINGNYLILPIAEDVVDKEKYIFEIHNSTGSVVEEHEFSWFYEDLDYEIVIFEEKDTEVIGEGGLNGVAPGAKIYAYKVLNEDGSGSTSGIIKAIQEATDPNKDGDYSDHVDVISMSLGGWGHPDDPGSQAVDFAVENGIVVVVAAGNSGPSLESIGSPGCARKALTVGASCKPDQIGNSGYCDESMAIFSSRGPTSIGGIKPDVIAPGVDICAAQWEDAWESSQCLDDEHTAISGTSMATPHVAGAAALLIQSHPDWTPEDIKSALMLNTDDFGYKANIQGTGQIDIFKANNAEFITSPQSLSFGYASSTELSETFVIKSLRNNVEIDLRVSNVTDSKGVEHDFASLNEINVELDNKGDEKEITLTVNLPNFAEGSFEGKIIIEDDNGEHYIPFTFTKLSKLTVNVVGDKPLYPDMLLHNRDITEVRGLFQGDVLRGGTHIFDIPSGNYTVYAVGDFEDVSTEYILSGMVEVLIGSDVEVTLNMSDARPYTIKARSLDDKELTLYEWEKAFVSYTDEHALAYSYIDPNYGDRTVYITSKPDNGVDTDIFFKYYGIPHETSFLGEGWSKGIDYG